jgi:hypothetical protein
MTRYQCWTTRKLHEVVNITTNIGHKSILETVKGKKPNTVEKDTNGDLWPGVLRIFIYLRGQNLEHCYQGINNGQIAEKTLPEKQYIHIYCI